MTTPLEDEVFLIERHLLLELSQLKKKLKGLKKMNLGDSARTCVERKRFSYIIVEVQEICLTLPIFRKILNGLS